MPPEVASPATIVRSAAGAPAGRVADLPPPDHTPEEARTAADEILARPEYQWSDDRSLLDRIAEWVADRLEDLFAPLGVSTGGLPVWVGWLVLAVLIVLVGVLLYRARAGWRRSGAVDAAAGSHVVVSVDDDEVDWAAEVERCESEGRWREALRARYRVLVGDLARRQVIGDLVGRTTGELVGEVRRTSPSVAPAFSAATDEFEEAWYGGAVVTAADRDRFVRLADEARTAAAAAADRAPAAPVGS